MFIKNTLNYSTSLIISILLIIFFSTYQINLEDLWFDELITFSITDPNLGHHETYERIIKEENTPPLYFFLIKFFFKLFGYNYQLLRLPNIIFNVISLIVFFSIIVKISKDKKFISLSLILFSLNWFLISYSHEGRVYSFYCMVSLIYIKIYLDIIGKNNSITSFESLVFFFFTTIIINTFLFSFLIIGTIFFYELFFRRYTKSFNLINILMFFSIIISLYLNLDFYQKVLNFKAISINNPDINFYLFNYFFNVYFGSKIMGLIFFVFFIFSIIFLIKRKLLNKMLNFLILLVLFSYLIPILYGYLFTPILIDKYIIYTVPIFILFISFSISQFNNSKIKYIFIYFLIILSFSNQLLKNVKKEIDKPEFTKILNNLNKINKSNYYIASFKDHQNAYFNTIVENLLIHTIAKKKIKFMKNKNEKNFWIICYDPSNTFKYCTEKNILLVKNNEVKDVVKTYQVVAILIHKK